LAADPYTVLGVQNNSSQDRIPKAYRLLAKKLHPGRLRVQFRTAQYTCGQSVLTFVALKQLHYRRQVVWDEFVCASEKVDAIYRGWIASKIGGPKEETVSWRSKAQRVRRDVPLPSSALAKCPLMQEWLYRRNF
jgi:hypothetical protein